MLTLQKWLDYGFVQTLVFFDLDQIDQFGIKIAYTLISLFIQKNCKFVEDTIFNQGSEFIKGICYLTKHHIFLDKYKAWPMIPYEGIYWEFYSGTTKDLETKVNCYKFYKQGRFQNAMAILGNRRRCFLKNLLNMTIPRNQSNEQNSQLIEWQLEGENNNNHD